MVRDPIMITGLLVAALAASSSAASPATLRWEDAAAFVQNAGFDATVDRPPFGRLPTAAKTGAWCQPPCPVRDKVWGEGQNGAGLYLAFATDATEVWLNATLLSNITEMATCSATCGSGMDIYAFDMGNATWRWAGTTTNSLGGGWALTGTQIKRAMVSVPPGRGVTRHRIHLPIYNAVTGASIGVPVGRTLSLDPPSPAVPAPVLFYGTSIVNGHVASRPGMIFTAQLSRLLGRPIVNLGFGGNGKMEASVGAVITRMRGLAAVVIDCNWNLDPVATNITTAAIALVRQLRAGWSPTKPIVLAEGSDAGAAWITPTLAATQAARRNALAAAFAALQTAGVPGLHYVHGEDLIGKSGVVDIPTALGTHPTDLGHSLIAEYYAKALPAILASADATAAGGRAGGGGADQVSDLATRRESNVVDSVAVSAQPDANATAHNGNNEHHSSADGSADAVSGSSSAGDASCDTPGSIVWTVARTDLTVGGRAAWDGLERENFYDRFPLIAKGNVTSEGARRGIWGLSKCSAGEYVEFALEGNVTALYVNYSNFDTTGVNPSGGRLSIMPPLGRKGIDLYAQSASTGAWVWAGGFGGHYSGPFDDGVCGPLTASGVMDSSAATRFILYLPLWRACSDDLAIGISAAEHAAGARVVPSTGGVDASKAPVVWYGTSIVHGAAVTRAGEGFTNRVSRALNRTVLNFGFSGSGHMDLGIGMWLAKIAASVYIIDCNWNMQAAEITSKVGPIVQQLRAARPTTPIVLAEGTPSGGLWLGETDGEIQRANNEALRAAFEKLKPSDSRLFYVASADLFADTPLDSPTVGGCHPSDLGAHEVAGFYARFLPSVVGGE